MWVSRSSPEGYLDVVNPLAGVQDLDSYAWPDPEDEGLLDSARAAIAGNDDACFVVPNLGFALFERAWTMRGMEQFLMDLSLDTGYAAELLDRITEIQLRLIERYIELGVDGAYFGDDYGRAEESHILAAHVAGAVQAAAGAHVCAVP